jgi:capsular polysaccharide biosynthesis protein
MIKKNNDSDEIDLLEVAKALLHRWWALVLAVVIFGAAAFGYTYFFIDPLYQSSTLLYVNNSDISLGATSFTISNADLTAAQKLVNTYVVILKSRTALSEVIEEAGLNYSYEDLKDMISAAAVNSTEVFEVVVTSKDPAEAERIANTIANVLPEKIADIVSGSDVRIVDYAVIPSHRSSPSYTRNTAIGMLLGLVLSAAAVILAGMFDDNIRSEDYLAQAYPDIPLLAVIPDMVGGKHSGGYYRYGGNGYYGYGGYYRKSSTGKKDEKTVNQPIPKQGEQKRA